jgi:hypothetical protein
VPIRPKVPFWHTPALPVLPVLLGTGTYYCTTTTIFVQSPQHLPARFCPRTRQRLYFRIFWPRSPTSRKSNFQLFSKTVHISTTRGDRNPNFSKGKLYFFFFLQISLSPNYAVLSRHCQFYLIYYSSLIKTPLLR